ncbi:hypothetical protein BH11BAC7_BH11BAC7_34080 [soil metagenome]
MLTAILTTHWRKSTNHHFIDSYFNVSALFEFLFCGNFATVQALVTQRDEINLILNQF